MPDTAVHYLVIGHIAKDLTPRGPRLGGTVAYAALTAHALGYPPGLVTAYGDDLDLGPLAGFPCARTASSDSTTFENIYNPDGRTQFLRARATPLNPNAIPSEWRRAPIIHLAPLAREVNQEMIVEFAGTFVGLTPQGWLRQWDAEGHVRNDGWPEAMEILPHASAAVLSLEDLHGDWSLAERWAKAARVLIITEGAQGCTVFAKGEGARQFPAPPETEVDPTGAGDIFAAAFFIHLYETEDPWAAARFANQMGAVSVTRPGLDGVPTPDEAALGRMTPARSGVKAQ
jgi:sugar/nucleoside kinase (ribokinase family)